MERKEAQLADRRSRTFVSLRLRGKKFSTAEYQLYPEATLFWLIE